MTDLRSLVKYVLHIKDDDKIAQELERDPAIKRARAAIDLGESVLAELEAIEQRKKRRR